MRNKFFPVFEEPNPCHALELAPGKELCCLSPLLPALSDKAQSRRTYFPSEPQGWTFLCWARRDVSVLSEVFSSGPWCVPGLSPKTRFMENTVNTSSSTFRTVEVISIPLWTNNYCITCLIKVHSTTAVHRGASLGDDSEQNLNLCCLPGACRRDWTARFSSLNLHGRKWKVAYFLPRNKMWESPDIVSCCRRYSPIASMTVV